MKIINDGKGMTIKLSFEQMATIVEAMREGVKVYEYFKMDRTAEEARELVDSLVNQQEIRISEEALND